MIQLHQLRSKTKLKRGKRIGRGGKRGSYSGRGIEGQKSRAGRQMVPPIRQLLKKYPKLRGYKFKTVSKPSEQVNLKDLEKNFKSGQVVSVQSLLEKRLIRKIKGRLPQAKILGIGKLTKALKVKSLQVSKSAEEKIKKAGGTIL
jgi:large subunit ribosomal protein L15